MDLVGKSLVKNQVSSITKTIGLSGEDKEDAPYDHKKEQENEERTAREKAKRDEAQLKKKADRAKERNKVREKYGLQESKKDQDLLESRSQIEDAAPKNSSKAKGKDDSSCLVM